MENIETELGRAIVGANTEPILFKDICDCDPMKCPLFRKSATCDKYENCKVRAMELTYQFARYQKWKTPRI